MVGRVIEGVIVSHRVSRKISGPLHKDTNYRAFKGEEGPRRAHRQELTKFTEATIRTIVDRKIRELVWEKWEENGGKAEKFATNPPFMTARDGRKIPIKKARYWETGKTFSVGKGKRNRRVVSEKNSHMEVYAVKDEKGREKKKWEAKVVNLLEAYERKCNRQSVVCRNLGDEKIFLFSLAKNETFRIGDEIFVVKSVSQEDRGYIKVEFTSVNKIEKKRAMSPGQFKAKGLCKVRVDVLGCVYPANE